MESHSLTLNLIKPYPLLHLFLSRDQFLFLSFTYQFRSPFSCMHLLFNILSLAAASLQRVRPMDGTTMGGSIAICDSHRPCCEVSSVLSMPWAQAPLQQMAAGCWLLSCPSVCPYRSPVSCPSSRPPLSLLECHYSLLPSSCPSVAAELTVPTADCFKSFSGACSAAALEPGPLLLTLP